MSGDKDALIYLADVRIDELEAENDKLREQTERLVTLLRNDCDIEASWDGLRRFWSIGLTESGCMMRDRACKAEAENAKLREQLADMPKCEDCEAMLDCDECLRADDSQKERKRLDYENEKLRELVRVMAYCNQHERDCDGCAMNGADGTITALSGCDELLDRLRELGVDA